MHQKYTMVFCSSSYLLLLFFFFFAVALKTAGFFFFTQNIIPQFRSTYCYSVPTFRELKGKYDIIISREIGQGLNNLQRKILGACPFLIQCRQRRLLRIFN